MIQSRVKLGSAVKAGEKLYKLRSFNKQGNLPYVIEIEAQTDSLVFDVPANYSVNQGRYVLSIW